MGLGFLPLIMVELIADCVLFFFPSPTENKLGFFLDGLFSRSCLFSIKLLSIAKKEHIANFGQNLMARF